MTAASERVAAAAAAIAGVAGASMNPQALVADLRIAFRRDDEGDEGESEGNAETAKIVIASFGSRHRPPGFYDKLRSRLAY